MSLEDRKRRAQEIIDSVPRAVQRAHPQYESEPPPIPSSYPPVVSGPIEDVLDRTRVAREVGFRSGLSHFRAAIQRLSRPVAALLALWGTVSWMAAVALTYWTTHHVVSVDRYAKDEAARVAEQNARDRDVEGLRRTVNDMREQIAELRGMAKAQQQLPIQAKPEARDMTRPANSGEKGRR
jgi:hypothetical protein